jgi:hypothetical protein
VDLTLVLLPCGKLLVDFTDNLLDFGQLVFLIVRFLIVDYFSDLIQFVKVKVIAMRRFAQCD